MPRVHLAGKVSLPLMTTVTGFIEVEHGIIKMKGQLVSGVGNPVLHRRRRGLRVNR
jgi:hypothetical protein